MLTSNSLNLDTGDPISPTVVEIHIRQAGALGGGYQCQIWPARRGWRPGRSRGAYGN